jgi:hypothetical protein
MSKTKNWLIKAKLTWHHFGGKINWFQQNKKEREDGKLDSICFK